MFFLNLWCLVELIRQIYFQLFQEILVLITVLCLIRIFLFSYSISDFDISLSFRDLFTRFWYYVQVLMSIRSVLQHLQSEKSLNNQKKVLTSPEVVFWGNGRSAGRSAAVGREIVLIVTYGHMRTSWIYA